MPSTLSVPSRALLGLVLALCLSIAACGNKIPKEDLLNRADLHYKAGWEYMGKGEYPKARQEFETAINFYPKLSEYYNALGLCHYFMGNFPIAEQRYRQAIEISSGLPDYHNNLANAYLAMEKWDEAIRWSDSALGLPNYRTPERALFVKGLAYAGMKDWTKAEQMHLKSIEKNPEYVNPYIVLATRYYEQGDCVKSLEYIRTARTLTSRGPDPGVMIVYAKVMFCFDKTLEGVEALMTVKELAPGTSLAEEAEQLLSTKRDALREKMQPQR